jgi:glycosyltransferase involved in cell wall biosynthesis
VLSSEVTVIIPCHNEEASLPYVLQGIPDRFQALVVDNGSTDQTALIGRALGAHVIHEPRLGYGSAVHAGIVAAQTPIVCTIDGDGSLDPEDLTLLLAALDDGADLAVGRRRPTERGVLPWHAQAGTTLAAWRLRHRFGICVRDIGPMRASRRDTLLSLLIGDRRSGYPVELLRRAADRGLYVSEVDVTYRPRFGGRSKVSGSVTGSLRAGRDFLAALS